MLVFECFFCGFRFSQNYGPFIWVQPTCPNCGSNQTGMLDLPNQPEYDIDELLYWADIGREAMSDESEFVEVPEETPSEADEIKLSAVDRIFGPKKGTKNERAKKT